VENFQIVCILRLVFLSRACSLSLTPLALPIAAQSVSLTFQRSEYGAEDYYDIAGDILGGDSDALLTLVSRMPDAYASKREEVRAVHDRRMASQTIANTIATTATATAASAASATAATAAVAALRMDANDAEEVVRKHEEEEDRALAAAMERAATLQWGGHGTGWQLPTGASTTTTNTTAADNAAVTAAAVATFATGSTRGAMPPQSATNAGRAAAARAMPRASSSSDVMASLQAELDDEEEDLCPVCLVEPPRWGCTS
jgi:hypothetical protein